MQNIYEKEVQNFMEIHSCSGYWYESCFVVVVTKNERNKWIVGAYRSLRTARLRRARRAACRASRLKEESMQTSGWITPAAANFERVLEDDFRTTFLISLAASILDGRSPLISFSDNCSIWLCFPRFHVSISSCSIASSFTLSPSPIMTLTLFRIHTLKPPCNCPSAWLWVKASTDSEQRIQKQGKP